MSYFRKPIVLLLVISYILVVNIGYIYFVSPAYSYLGYTFSEPHILDVMIATLLILIVTLFSPIDVKIPSDFIFWFLFIVLYVPSMYIPLYTIISIQSGVLTMFPIHLVITMVMMGLIWMRKIPLININTKNVPYKHFLIVFFGIFLILFVIIVRKFGFHIRLVQLDEVYDLRYSYREAKDVISTYAVTWFTKCIGPTLISLGLLKKKPHFVLLGFFSQIMIYSISGHKSVLFSTALLFLIYCCLSKNGKSFSIKFLGVFTGGLLLFIIIDLARSTDILTSLFLRRFIVTPGLLLGMYYEFFSFNPKALYAYSLFNGIFDDPYSTTPAFTIGLNYFGKAEVSANANLWADGFANFGIPGVIGVSLLLMFIAYICNCLALKFKNVSIVCLITAMPIWALTDTSLLTTLLTHGMLLNLLILYFLPKDQQEYNDKSGKKIPN
ncbi:hypothetical protein BWGOE3_52420 [Bacillus mycoides]|uniref:hypothetical protein n=1 Tax=Bacillus cereus group TaxID=86661 RepID=UPI00087207E0|nr:MULTISPECIES: hypothetical protein [Bacillus cereus group]MBJ8072274.1 hypothetical protein [Bacillus cereus]MDM5465105.1 hypothetical protein [Bacillus cereus]OFD38237.1 hypothetical protein BWGOE3_52420 [Bacillus mycoides]OFD40635.1 hypothetical protein BWGOE1_52330 [Bacillus mycoides]OFD55640.1 hypothetical protein BWGOE6_52630 [Bacillus mycoides]